MARKKAIKQPRRKPGTGCIRFKQGRTRPHEAEFPIEGHPSRREAFATKVAAQAWLDQLVEDRDKAGRNIAGGSTLTADYLSMWLELRRGHIGLRTWTGYEYYCGVACGQGGLGRIRIDSVTALIAQRMINKLADDKFKNTAQLKAVLFQAFEYAFDPLEYIKKNPFAKVDIPTIEHTPPQALTKAERLHLLECAVQDDALPFARHNELPPPLLLFWHLCARLAFRRGEALSLKWSSINLDTAVVTIATTLGRLGKEHIEGQTKGKKIRVAPLPVDMVELFRAMKIAQMRIALANGWRWNENGYVFVNKMGAVLTVDMVYHRWERLRAAAKINTTVTIHDLRHTSLTILALDGVPQNIRMALAGHKTEEMADYYANHASIEDVRKAVG